MVTIQVDIHYCFSNSIFICLSFDINHNMAVIFVSTLLTLETANYFGTGVVVIFSCPEVSD